MRKLRAHLFISSTCLLASCGDSDRIDMVDPDEAKAALLQVATLQELFYLDHDEYTNDILQLRFATNPAYTGSGSFRIEVVLSDDGQEYSATAAYVGANFSNQECQLLSIDSRGNKGSQPNSNCWDR